MGNEVRKRRLEHSVTGRKKLGKNSVIDRVVNLPPPPSPIPAGGSPGGAV